MKNVFRCMLLAAASLLFTAQVRAQIQFLHDVPFDKVLQLAKDSNKMIFMDGYIFHCAPCKELDKKVFPLPVVGDYFNASYICVKYDIDSAEGKKVQQRYKDVITGFPSLLLIDKDGKMIHKIGGYHQPDSLIAKMKDALHGRSLSEMRTRFAGGEQSVGFMQEYMKILEDGYLREEIEGVKKALLARLPNNQLIDTAMWKIVGTAVNDPYAPCFGYVVNNYFRFIGGKVTDINRLEFQLVTAIESAMNEIVKAEDNDGNLQLKNEPEKAALLIKYMTTGDFRHAETVRATFKIHELKLAGKWSVLVNELTLFHSIKALGRSDAYIDESIRYMMQHCQDKKVLSAAVDLLASVQAEKTKGMNMFGENYCGTIIHLYQLLGNQQAAKKYEEINKAI